MLVQAHSQDLELYPLGLPRPPPFISFFSLKPQQADAGRLNSERASHLLGGHRARV